MIHRLRDESRPATAAISRRLGAAVRQGRSQHRMGAPETTWDARGSEHVGDGISGRWRDKADFSRNVPRGIPR